MNQYLKTIQNLLQQNNQLSEQEKQALLKTLTDADKQWSITEFKLDRTEKVKRTTAILLEETIEELEHKRKAVEQQNRELEIESSLEKVRTVAMGMRNRDDMLDICRTMSAQLESLGIKEIRNVQTAIFYKDKGTYINYEYYRLHDKALVTEVDYTNDEISIEFAAQMVKGADEVFIRSLEGQQVKDWLHFQKTTNVFIDTNLEKAKSLTYYWFSLGPVAIGTSTYDPLSEEEITLFKRFRNVFDLAYRRYLDIEKAEAQAREAQIEAALEKVRSRSLAMHKSDELQEVVHAVFERLNELNFELDTAIIIIFTEGSKDTVWWLQNSANQQYLRIAVNYADILYLRKLFEAKENKKDLPPASYSLEQKNELLNYLFDHTDFRFTPPEQKEFLLQKEWATMSAAIANNTAIHITRYSKKSFSEKENEILKKFSNVFEQAYTRFLDLQKAEEQARESQIQLALERVRARTMAMHHSSELSEAATLVFEQLSQLGAELWSCGFNICKEDSEVVERWMSLPNGKMLDPLQVPLSSGPEEQIMYDAWKNRVELFTFVAEGAELHDGFESLKSHPSTAIIYTRLKQIGIPFPTWMQHFVASFKQGSLWIMATKPFDETQIFVRFAKVFEQTYTRFLDLQKAEAQAREAQIELALERVRARTMAMQKSDELAETSLVLFQQFKDLGETSEQISIGIFKEDENIMELYSTLYGSQWKEAAKVDLDEPVVMKKIHTAWKEQKKSRVIDIAGDDLRKYNEYRKKLSNLEYREDRWVIHIAFFSKGVLTFSTTEPHPPETIQLLERFAGVFDQTYTRFLDLQKAEAQARESQIQLALERVRARTMAMQRSEELGETAVLLFKQIADLGAKSWSSGFQIWQSDDHFSTAWMTNPDGSMGTPFTLPYTGDPFFKRIYEARKSGKDFFVMESSGEELKETYRYMFSLPEVKEVMGNIESLGFQLPTFQITHCAFFLHGFLMIITYEPVAELWDIFKRFAKVFEQTYTRFLDLQKAEAQAREAKIEAALEKVRSRSLAMHKSEELQQVVTVAFERLKELNISMDAANIVIFSEGTRDAELWIASPGQEYVSCFHLPYVDHLIPSSIFNAREKGDDFFAKTFSFEEKNKYFNYLFEHSDFRHLPENRRNKILAATAYAVSFAFTKNAAISIHNYSDKPFSDEENNILKRFAKVFEQAYTRFLDLQKAEAQAREAQIEASLERVRASAMAMHHTDELSDVLSILFQQFDVLDIRPVDAHLDLFDLEKNTFSYRATGKEGKRVIAEQIVNLDSRPEWQSLAERWKKGKPNAVDFSYYPKEVIRDLMAFFPGIWASMPPEAIMVPEVDFPDGIYDALGYCKFGFLGFHHNRKTTKEENRILIRFANEFERLYQRFLDLQKAEAQAREAQIELGLERVRARAMAMQSSNELSELVDTVFKELTKLDFALTWCIINIIDEPSLTNTVWAANPDIDKAPESYYMKFEDYPFHHAMMKGWKERKTKYVYTLEGLEKKVYDEYLFNETEFRRVPEAAQAASRAIEKYVVSFSFSNFGGLQTVGDVPLSDANLDILSRFGKVFDLTYTRFNDLKQAEAQARESQIQLAMERVRARTMAMQKSDELAETASLLFKQINDLGIQTWTSGFNIWGENDASFIGYNPTPSGDIAAPYSIPSTEDSFFVSICEAKKRGEDFFVFESSGKSLAKTYSYMKTLPVVKDVLKGIEESGFQLPKFQINHCAFFSHGFLLFITLEAYPEAHNIFKRFGKVFEQTYTRFLDLQKAEAQARESQIELGLERVRARAMAMQRSDELKELIATVSAELGKLDLVLDRCFIEIYDSKTLGSTWWMANHETPTEGIGLFVKYHEHPTYQAHIKAWQERIIKWQYILEGETKKTWDKILFSETELSQLPVIVSSNMKANEKVYLSASFSNFGCLLLATLDPLSDEQFDILLRFAKVFDLTYTRFNDLQKAEAQAREAQIETALERVRSRTMGMQKSEELKEVIQVVYEQFVHLNIHIEHTGFIMDYKARDDMNIWLADRHEVPSQVTIPYFDCAHWNSFNEAKEKGKDFFANHLSFEEKNKFYQDLFKLIPGVPEETLEYYFSCPGLAISTVLLENVSLYIENFSGIPYSDEENSTLMRFGKVFQQTYTRFLDLQKAEAQAREAQIEGALERVRSRTMAMHRSEEIADIVGKIFGELRLLDLVLNRVLIWIFNDEERYISWWSANPEVESNAESYRVDYNEHPVFLSYLQAWQKRLPLHLYTLSGDTKKTWEDHLFTNSELSKLPMPVRKGMREEGTIFTTSTTSDYGLMMVGSFEPLSDANTDIIQRFGRVFQQSYTRYLDVQKAEAQAREAKIEAALERVRSRAMAMHTSTELKDVAFELRNRMGMMAQPELEVCAIHLYDESPDYFESWAALRPPDNQGEIIQVQAKFPKRGIRIVEEMMHAYHSGKKDYVLVNEGEKVPEWLNQLKEKVPEGYEMIMQSLKGIRPEDIRAYWSISDFQGGALVMTTYIPLNEEARNLLRRFANVFGLAYRRFVDLKQAEAQAREAKIEAALERVRSKAMAMHKSEDLNPAVATVFEELDKLDLGMLRCGIGILYRDKRTGDVWTTAKSGEGNIVQTSGDESMDIHPLLQGAFDAWSAQRDFSYVLEGEDLINYYQALTKTNFQLPESASFDTIKKDQKQFYYVTSFESGTLFAFREREFPEEAKTLMKRFANVFNLTYKRFLDLQKAEAQAREAQIELGLERVRARAMAMQNSDELSELVAILFDELVKLDLVLARCIIWIFDKDTLAARVWMANSEDKKNAESYFIKRLDHPYYDAILKGWKERNPKWVYDLRGKNKRSIDKLLLNETELAHLPDAVKAGILSSEHTIISGSFNNFGLIEASGPATHSEEQLEILNRFGKVFDLSYTRFSDLKQAEAQAREAKIEAAMEKVRARAMAMQKPGELIEVAQLLRKEMGMLGVEELETSSIYIHDEVSGTTECWYAIQDIREQNRKLVTDYMTIQLNDTWVGREMLKFYTSDQKQTSILMRGENRKEWINYCAQHSKVLQGYYGDVIPERTYHLLKFSNGYMGAASPGDISAESWELLKRATSVFSLAYTRFSDLQLAEANAKEAIKQSALDRIRADIASMRTTADLDKITPLIWNELTILGIPFIRCGVFIMDDSQKLIHSFLSTPEGKAIAAFHIPYDSPGNIKQVLSHWQNKKNYIDHWDEKAFTEFANTLVKQGALNSPQQYLKTIPKGGFHLHFLPFLQGMLYVGNTIQLNEDEIKLIQSVADAFSTAYARYEDFNKLEAAKQQVEKTLVDLKQAQTQLVQSEKMASLGELTAGIAHEIQNPLNFVNNFSDVSNELLDEMKTELEKGNKEDAMAIADDVKQNLEKILHHGKRADAIVKGMLQHSRMSSGQKELTDINNLADEYLRLAYHGLRAKDKSFNAKFETDFDKRIGKINIIPQDIGRVLVNLMTNAFYAVSEKAKLSANNYEPMVIVTTKKISDKVEIKVRDNGTGIPQKVLDKIFQPFFTTKPTGQGTGLGLSLAYDIVKAHGGEIKVETLSAEAAAQAGKEGEGSEFIISLPV